MPRSLALAIIVALLCAHGCSKKKDTRAAEAKSALEKQVTALHGVLVEHEAVYAHRVTEQWMTRDLRIVPEFAADAKFDHIIAATPRWQSRWEFVANVCRLLSRVEQLDAFIAYHAKMSNNERRLHDIPGSLDSLATEGLPASAGKFTQRESHIWREIAQLIPLAKELANSATNTPLDD